MNSRSEIYKPFLFSFFFDSESVEILNVYFGITHWGMFVTNIHFVGTYVSLIVKSLCHAHWEARATEAELI